MLITPAWAQDAAANATAGAANIPAMIFSYAPLILIVAVFYFLVLRPQAQQAKAQAAMLKALTKGDVVETVGGMVGVLTKVDEKFVKLKAGDAEMVFARSAVARKLPADEATKAGVKK